MRTIHLLFITLMVMLLAACGHETIYIVHDPDSTTQQEIACELADYLGLTYPGLTFEAVAKEAEGQRNIVFKADPALDASNEEAYEIHGSTDLLQITGSSDRGIIHGSYALLKALGWHFYLSFEIPPHDPEPLDMAGFDLSDAPAKDTRIIFNWHNFMSGCSGWNLEDWQSWTTQARKTGFNTIMVHAYGNNPMQPLQMGGVEKEVGYLTTTRKGRDWGSQHVNDVRRMIGGALFEDAEFGSNAAKVPEDMRSQSAVKLMQEVFSHAEALSMNVCYAIDVDTWMANPQAIMKTLPSEALLKVAEYQLANPDHPAGKTYYLEKLGRLFSDYPQITHLAAWMRRPPLKLSHGWGTAWLKIQYEDMPASWKDDFDALARKHPEITREMPYPAYFAMSKIIRLYREILDELKPEVELVLGSWQLYYPPIADLFMPDYCGFIPLDYSYVLNRPDNVEALSRVGRHRKLYPVVWAHHDDHRYMGRPYIPYPDFNKLLDETHSDGYGIIHWTTHPLDLYFENSERQVWQSSLNQEISVSVKDFCRALLLEEDEDLLHYYELWFSEGPMFGRETMDHFIDTRKDYTLEGYESSLDAMERAKQRLKLLESLSPEALSPYGQKEVKYQAGMEKFIIAFFNNHHHLHQAYQALEGGKLNLALDHVAQLSPEAAIEQYAHTIDEYGATRGEMGLLVSMNLRWLPDYADMRQRVRQETIRINFQPTSHDSLAQGAGRYTYFIDEEGVWWKGMGEKECGDMVTSGGQISGNSVWENCVHISSELRLPIQTFRDHALPAGSYKMEVTLAAESPQHPFRMRIEDAGNSIASLDAGTDKNTFELTFLSEGKDLDLVVESPSGEIRLACLTLTPISDTE